MAEVKQIKIQTGVVKRYGKEKLMYEKENEQLQKKVEKMKEDGKDEYDIKKQIEVQQESAMMIPDCKRRLIEARGTLTGLMTAHEKDLAETEEYKAAVLILDETKALAE